MGRLDLPDKWRDEDENDAHWDIDALTPELRARIEAVKAGDRRHQRQRFPQASRASHTLSPRELEVIQLVAKGCSNAQIAASLLIGAETVKTHTEHVRRKLDARNRAHAVAIAYQQHLLNPNA